MLFACGIALGCVGPLPSEQGYGRWHKAGAGPVDFEGDRAACLEQATERVPIVQSRQALPSYDVNEERFQACLEGRGWQLDD